MKPTEPIQPIKPIKPTKPTKTDKPDETDKQFVAIGWQRAVGSDRCTSAPVATATATPGVGIAGCMCQSCGDRHLRSNKLCRT